MGLEDRDYVRNSPPPGGYGYGGGFGSGSGYWAVKFLLIANIVVFILQMGSGVVHNNGINGGVTDWLDLKMASKLPESTKFREVTFEGSQPPRALGGEGSTISNTVEILEAGTSVRFVDYRTGDVMLIETGGRYGIIPNVELKPAPLQSWQLSWRLLTSGFCHGGLMHIAFNMFVLFMFGRLIEPIYGSKEFLLIFLFGVVVSGLAHIAIGILMGTNHSAVGASGGVMSIVCITAMTYPRAKVLLFLVIPMEMRWMAVLVIGIDLLGLFGIHIFGGNTAHAAHLGGAAFGIAYKYYGWRLSGFFSGWKNPLKRRPRKPKLRVHRPDDDSSDRVDQLDAKVDALLAKISEQGEASLTDEEREILAEASRKYRKR